jgi:hypothetical protein
LRRIIISNPELYIAGNALKNVARRNNSRRVMKSCNRELDDIGFQGIGGEGTSVPD